jgi:hypothetical protein
VNFLSNVHVHVIRNVRIHNAHQPEAVQDILRSGVQFLKEGCSIYTYYVSAHLDMLLF